MMSLRAGFVAILAGTFCSWSAAAPVVALSSVENPRVQDAHASPTGLQPAGGDAARAPGTLGMHSAFGRVTRGSMGESSSLRGVDPCNPPAPTGLLIEMLDTLETLDPLPTPLGGQFSSPMWTNHPVSDSTQNSWTSSIAPFAGAVDDVIGANDTRKVRLFVSTAFPPDQFFFGWGTNLLRSVNPVPQIDRLSLRADVGAPARAGHEAWNSSAASMWTSEAVHVTSGFIASRLLWGGTCGSGCTANGLPQGPISHYYWLDSFGLFSFFEPAVFIGAAPAGFNVGDQVPVVSGSWHRITHEIDASDTLRVYIDFLDGQGEYLIVQAPAPYATRIDRVGGNMSVEAQSETHYIDNVFASGFDVSDIFPPPLFCCGGSYSDNIDWMNVGALGGQTNRWIVPDGVGGVTVAQGINTRHIRAQNTGADNTHRELFRTRTPETFAFGSSSFALCVDAEVSNNNATSRAVTLRRSQSSEIGARNVVARLFLGVVDPMDPGAGATQRLYLQINPDFEPIDAAGPDPLLNAPIIGVDIADIGAFAHAQEQRICVEVDPLGGVTVSVDGVEYVAGAPMLHPGAAAISRLSFESKQNAQGFGNVMNVDNVELLCDVLPLVTYPDLSLVYLDDLSAYIADVPMGAQRDSDDPLAATRWTSTVDAVLRDLGVNVVEMRNVNRDQPTQIPGPTSVFTTQATTSVPAVDFEQGARGWAVGGRFRMTDGATTRIWSAVGTVGGVQRVATSVAYSANTGTLWVRVPNPNDVLDTVPPTIFGPGWLHTGRTFESMGVAFGDWFDLTIHLNTDGRCTFRVNNQIVRSSGGPIINTLPLRRNNFDGTWSYNTRLESLSFLSGEESAAPMDSTFYVRSVTSWALPCAGDATGNGFVNFDDLSIVLGNFGSTGQDLPGNIAPDINGDGVPDDNTVNFDDLSAVLGGFGSECD